MWTLHVTNSFKDDTLEAALNDTDEYIRGWAIQLLTEDRKLTSELAENFAVIAKKESSPVVRLKLAASIQRLPNAQRWEIAKALVSHAMDADDHNSHSGDNLSLNYPLLSGL
ncbi:MAG: hypothetical protein ACI9SQ_002082 [Rubritalea sp.]|jgi:hypothetical protein